MLHLGEGRPQEAWRDLQAMHRLARLIGQQGWLIHQLVAIAIDQMALKADASLLHEADLSAAEVREILKFLVQLPPPCNVAQAIDKTERLMMLDSIAHIARYGTGPDLPEFGLLLLLRSSIDWNVPLQMANVWYDKLATALDLPTAVERQAAIAAVESELVELAGRTRTPGTMAGALISGSKRSEVAGQIMLSLFLPALGAAQQAEDRSVASLRLVQVAAALALYRAEHGEFPASLDALAAPPGAQLPADPFTEKPFLYEKREEGYVLWSVGRNLQDDQASGREFFLTAQGEPVVDEQALDSGQDDIVLRVPWAMTTGD
jgi:hypothetical protein